MISRTLLSSLTVLALVAATGTARADGIPPDVAACDTKTAGAPCTLWKGEKQTSGTCRAAKCRRLDYRSWDGGLTPPSIEYDCLQCETSSDGGAGNDAGTNTQTSGGGCSASGAKLAGSWGLALVPMTAIGLVRRLRRRKG
jgi:hypothetical protein